MDPFTLEQSREELIRVDLVAHKKPLYQVLALDHPRQNRSGNPQSLGRVFKTDDGGSR